VVIGPEYADVADKVGETASVQDFQTNAYLTAVVVPVAADKTHLY
jgi:hypothetical protein